MRMEYLVFKRSRLFFGIGIVHIRQVIANATIAPVPLTPPGYAGLIFYRGELFDVADLGVILGERPGIKSEANPTILLKWNQNGMALSADEIVGLKSIEEKAVEPENFLLEGMQLKIITPERVWKMLSELSYGPRQI